MKKLTKIMFYIPKKFLIKLIFILFLLLSFNIYVNAETINNTCSSINQACSTNGRYTYSLYQSAYDTYSTGTFKTTYNGRADYMVFDFDYDLLGNATYQLSVSANSTDFRNINKSNVSIESSSECATPTGYLDITNVSFSKSKLVITFKTVSNSSRFILAIGDPEGPAITGVSTFGINSIDITTLESNDTQNIIDNQNQNTNSIIDNAYDNTQSIIDNQDKNNEELKDTIKDALGGCELYSISLNNNNIISSGYLNSSGSIIAGDGWGISDYIEIYGGYTYNLSKNFAGNSPSIVFYDSNKNYVNGVSFNGLTSIDFTLDENVKYFRVSLGTSDSDNALIISSTEICTNKLDETNDKLEDINGTLNDGTPPDTESFLDNLKNSFNDGPISTLILMPLTLINHYVDGFNSTCSPINLGELYGTNLNLPCINLQSKLGSSLWTTIDGLISIFMIYNICMLFVSAFNDITSLRDTFDSLYVPQHARPLGKHTSEVE